MSLFVSFMRTAVPLVAGWVLTLLVALGVDYSSTAVTSVVTALLTAAYYLVFRLLENAAPTGGKAEKLFGFLLGWARPPEYPSSQPATVAPVRGPPADPYA